MSHRVHTHTHTHTRGTTNDQSLNLLQCSPRSP